MRSSYFFIFTLYQCIVMQYTSDTRVSNGYDFHACMKGHIHLKPASGFRIFAESRNNS